jgi:L-ribulokinase
MERVVLTSGLAESNPLLVQTIADVLGRDVEVPVIANPTAVGAAIHGAVAAGLIDGYAEGARRYGARTAKTVRANAAATATYERLYQVYRGLGEGTLPLRDAMHRLAQIG